MKASDGDPQFPVWLVADSPPKNWSELLLTPLDPRHPARHSIWTSVLDYMQEALYRSKRRRFDTTSLYIRNAITDPDKKQNISNHKWSTELTIEVEALREIMLRFKPQVVLTFGAFAFEFVRRAHGQEPQLSFTKWTTKRLGEEFRESIKSYNSSGINIFPLLHVSIARGKFLESHRDFVGKEMKEPVNYFEFVGTKLAILFLRELRNEPIWLA